MQKTKIERRFNIERKFNIRAVFANNRVVFCNNRVMTGFREETLITCFPAIYQPISRSVAIKNSSGYPKIEKSNCKTIAFFSFTSPVANSTAVANYAAFLSNYAA